MKPLYHLITAVFFFLFLSINVLAQQGKSGLPQPAVYQQKMQSSALLFMENKGQVADDKGNLQPNILFTANSGGAKIYLTANSIHYQFSKTDYPKGYDPFSKEPAKDPQQEEALRKQIRTSTHRFTVELQGANLHPTVSKQEQSSYYENYYLAQCPNGITNVHGYEKIVYKNVYPNIDWIVYSKGGYMEYDFLVHPGGNPANIKLKIKDANAVSITPQGELLMKTRLGEVKEKAPVSYADGRIVTSRFSQNNDGTVGFDVQPQPGKELRIDPSIVWSTYYGGTGHEGGCFSAVDGSSNVYLNGLTWSTAGLSSGGFQNTYGGGSSDVFLVKFNSAGSRMWATYYGGSDEDYPSAFTTDLSGNVYLPGGTKSAGSIASGGFQNTYSGGYGDAFLVKFNSAGSRVWSTYYGGSGTDGANCCAVDAGGNIYLSGNTASATGIASGGFQNTYSGGGNQNTFLVKFNSTGSRIWGTYYGGTNSSFCTTDANSNVYISGSANSATGVASGGFQNTLSGISDAMLVKFNSNGNRIWATYYGGPDLETGSCCCVDNNDNVYLCGYTSSLTGIAAGGFQNSHGNPGGNSNDAYLVKFSSTGNRLWATYYGGLYEENFSYCTTNASGSVYLSGQTGSSVGIAFSGFQNAISTFLGPDTYIVKFTSNGSRVWGSYFGGLSYESSGACVADNSGNVYISGHTGSGTNIASNGFQNAIGGMYDGYLAKIADEPLCISATQPTISATTDSICAGNGTTLSIASGSLNSATTWQWRKDSCNGATVGTGISLTVSPTATTTYFVRGEGGCAVPGNCTSKTIVVNPAVTASVALVANPTGTIVAGTPVTFTANPTNGGLNPIYSFRVNNVIVQTSSSNVYTTNNLVNGDVVVVLMRSNMPCVTNSQIDSPPITIVVAVPCIQPTTPTISTNYDTVCTGATPTLSITSGNLNSATHWQWYTDSCGGTPVGNTSSITFTPAVTTTYYVRGEGGCITSGNCASKTIYVKPKPIVTFSFSPSTLCTGDTSNITFTGTAPANAIYTWNWGGGTVVSGSGAGPYKVVYNTAGSIGLTISNGTCSVASAVQSINPASKPELTFSVSDSISCENLPVTLSAYSLNINSWTWDFGDGTTLSNVNTPVQHTYAAGNYIASLTVHRGICSTTASKPIRVYQKPVAGFFAQPGTNTPVLLSQVSFSFTNTSQNASRYVWQFGDATTAVLTNPLHRYTAAGTYAVKLFAYNAGNCVDSFEMQPFIIKGDTLSTQPVSFNIPNAFSPNNDGINDVWMISGLQGGNAIRIAVYNRWGQAVFTNTGYSKPWDGTYKGKPLPVDTYYYVIIADNKSYTGSVFLLR